MGPEPNQIAEEIAHSRAELGSNLAELQHKFRGVTDWRRPIRKKPMAMVGLALGGGMLLAGLLSRLSTNSRYSKWRRRQRWIPLG